MYSRRTHKSRARPSSNKGSFDRSQVLKEASLALGFCAIVRYSDVQMQWPATRQAKTEMPIMAGEL
jgi:hypothetical protein